jgi:hypothetical protein
MHSKPQGSAVCAPIEGHWTQANRIGEIGVIGGSVASAPTKPPMSPMTPMDYLRRLTT